MHDRLAELRRAAGSDSNPFASEADERERERDLERGPSPQLQTAPDTPPLSESSLAPSPLASQMERTDAFLASAAEAQRRIERIERATKALDDGHRGALSAATADEAREAGVHIAALTAQISADSNWVRSALHAFSTEATRRQADQSGAPVAEALSDSDVRLRTGQQTRLSRRFLAAMRKLEAVQRAHRERYRRQMERQLLIVQPEATAAELEAVVSAADEGAMSRQLFAMANRAAAQQGLAAMRERHAEILAIEASVEDVHRMFADIALMVERQGVDIDRLETHVGSAAEYTEQGAVQMRAVAVKQRRRQKRKWISAGILIVIAIVLFAALVMLIREALG